MNAIQDRTYASRFTYRLVRIEWEGGRTVNVIARMEGDTVVDYFRQYV